MCFFDGLVNLFFGHANDFYLLEHAVSIVEFVENKITASVGPFS